MSVLDVILVNPGGRELIYQELGTGLTAIEPPLWCRLIGGYLRDQAPTAPRHHGGFRPPTFRLHTTDGRRKAFMPCY